MALSISNLGAGHANSTNSGTKSLTATPSSAGRLIVVFTGHTGYSGSTAPTDDQGGTYSLICGAVKNGSADKLEAWVRDQLSPAVSMTITHAPGGTSGGFIAAQQVNNISKAGLDAIVQYATEDNQSAGTPAPTFGAAAQSANGILGVLFNATNPSGMTAPSGYTESFDSGYSSPTTGYEVARRNSGETGTAISWGSSSASVFCSIVLEIDASQGGPAGRADETDAALALAAVQSTAAGLASGSETALALAAVQIAGVGRADESDSALALSTGQGGVAGLAEESDASLALAAVQALAAGLASATDSAAALGSARPVGSAGETDAALALAAVQAAAVGLSTEADSGFALAGVQRAAVGLATETGSTLALGGVQIRAAALAGTSDIALALAAVQIGDAGLASEADSALALPSTLGGAAGRADESDAALALVAVQIRAAGLVVETDSALALAAVQLVAVGLAAVNDNALALGSASPAGLSSETDFALALTGGGTVEPLPERRHRPNTWRDRKWVKDRLHPWRPQSGVLGW